MAITSKQRCQLRGLAAAEDTIIQVGKGGITDNLIASVNAALKARELVKINVQRNCLTPVREIAEMLSERTRSEIVQVIGRKFVLYRYSSEKKNHIPLKKETD